MKPHKLTHSQQAANIIERFNGARKLALAIRQSNPEAERSPSTIYRWTYPRNKGGCDGRIPNGAWPAVLDAARYVGIFLTDKEKQP